MKLTENFSLHEFTDSQAATRLGIDNTPSPEHMPAIKTLCEKLLQLIRKGPVRAGIDLATQYVVDRSRLGFNNTAAELGPLLLNKNRADNLETLRRLDVLKDNLSRMAGQRAGAYSAGAGLSGLLSQ